jgi:hypothetical protein
MNPGVKLAELRRELQSGLDEFGSVESGISIE